MSSKKSAPAPDLGVAPDMFRGNAGNGDANRQAAVTGQHLARFGPFLVPCGPHNPSGFAGPGAASTRSLGTTGVL